MGIAVLVFSLVVGFFHLQGDAPAMDDSQMLASEPEVPASYVEEQGPSTAEPAVVSNAANAANPLEVAQAEPTVAHKALPDAAALEDNAELAQLVADLVAANPPSAASVLKLALARTDENTTLGDVATLTAAATRAAPGEAPAIAGTVTRALKDRGDAVLAAAVATIVSLVPEQSRDIGLVVGAIIGDDVEALGMVAQTVAISTGEPTFASLSEASGVSVGTLMRASSEFGSSVPFDVPAYAAQLAPSPSQVADTEMPSDDGEAEL